MHADVERVAVATLRARAEGGGGEETGESR